MGSCVSCFIAQLLSPPHPPPAPATQSCVSCVNDTHKQTQCFITAMDALKLEQRAVDEVQPLIYDLSDRLNKVSGPTVEQQ